MATIAEDTERFFGATGVDANADSDEEKVDRSDIIVEMKNVQKTYLLGVEGVPALRGVSVTVKRGEFVVIFGTSGGGKTSMLNVIGTIDKPTKGELVIDGTRVNQDTTDKTLSYIRLNTVGFVFQTFNLLGSMTAMENVMMPMILQSRLSAAERKTRATELLTMVGMGERLDHYPSMLSGGEQQRVTIARAIANTPALLLLDEPTGDLDTVNGAIVMKLLTDLNRDKGITLVMVTHDVSLKGLANRVIWMRDGKLQRVEVNSEESRQAMLQSLMENVEKSRPKKATDAGPAAVVYQNTYIRPPSHYVTVASVNSKKGRKEYSRRMGVAGVTDEAMGTTPVEPTRTSSVPTRAIPNGRPAAVAASAAAAGGPTANGSGLESSAFTTESSDMNDDDLRSPAALIRSSSSQRAAGVGMSKSDSARDVVQHQEALMEAQRNKARKEAQQNGRGRKIKESDSD